jgi:hypothetical protein
MPIPAFYPASGWLCYKVIREKIFIEKKKFKKKNVLFSHNTVHNTIEKKTIYFLYKIFYSIISEAFEEDKII